jgi:hypothetical protein
MNETTWLPPKRVAWLTRLLALSRASSVHFTSCQPVSVKIYLDTLVTSAVALRDISVPKFCKFTYFYFSPFKHLFSPVITPPHKPQSDTAQHIGLYLSSAHILPTYLALKCTSLMSFPQSTGPRLKAIQNRSLLPIQQLCRYYHYFQSLVHEQHRVLCARHEQSLDPTTDTAGKNALFIIVRGRQLEILNYLCSSKRKDKATVSDEV